MKNRQCQNLYHQHWWRFFSLSCGTCKIKNYFLGCLQGSGVDVRPTSVRNGFWPQETISAICWPHRDQLFWIWAKNRVKIYKGIFCFSYFVLSHFIFEQTSKMYFHFFVPQAKIDFERGTPILYLLQVFFYDEYTAFVLCTIAYGLVLISLYAHTQHTSHSLCILYF